MCAMNIKSCAALSILGLGLWAGCSSSKPRPAVAQVSAADRLAEFLRRQEAGSTAKLADRLAAMPVAQGDEPEDDFAELDMS